MYQIATLEDGTHFRFHDHDSAGLRVSFDQTGREQVWGVIPYPPAGYTESHARWIAEYSASQGTCTKITSTRPGQ